MQQNYVDAADRFKSLDDIWYFGGQDEHRQVAAMDHLPQNRDEIEIRIGKIVVFCKLIASLLNALLLIF